MLPRRPAQIFRSRWSALYWAGGVLFFAVTTIGFGDGSGKPQSRAGARQEEPARDAADNPVSNEDIAALRKFIDG